jgi:uncharacterized protein YdaU (DUF1376 family)
MFPLYTDAYLADTRHLTTMEHGAYLLLLMAAWRSPDACLPLDHKRLARIAGLTLDRWHRIAPTVLEFWQRETTDGVTVLVQKRIRDERRQYNRLRESRAAGGRAKALKRHDRDPASQVLNPANPIPIPNPIPKEERNGASPLFGDDPEPPPRDLIRDVVDRWNSRADETGLPPCRWPLADARRKAVKARIEEHGVETVLGAVDSLPNRKFIGNGPTQWRADFGKLMRAETFTALLEGRYDRPLRTNRDSVGNTARAYERLCGDLDDHTPM